MVVVLCVAGKCSASRDFILRDDALVSPVAAKIVTAWLSSLTESCSMLKSTLFITASLLVCPLAVHAQDADKTAALEAEGIWVHEKAPVTVTITRERLPIAMVAQPVDILEATDIKAYQSLFVADLLSHTTDLSLARNGGPGEAAAASIRGAGADHTLYLLDGIRLNDPSQVGGGTNLGLLTTGDTDRIEVLRGPLSTLWGSGALGGVISITSHTTAESLEGGLAVEGFDRYGAARAHLAGNIGDLAWGVSGSTYNDQGVSAFAGGTEKDGFTQTGLNGHLAYSFGDTTIRAFSSTSHSRNAYDGYVPPLYNFGDTADFGKTDTVIAALGVTNRYDDGEQTLSLAQSDTRRDDFSAGGVPAFSARGHIQSADYHASYKTGGTRLLGGVSYERDSMSGDTRAATTLTSAYGQVVHDFGPIEATMSARHDDASSFGGLDIAQMSFTTWPRGRWRFHASAGTGVKAPSLYQLYSSYGTDSLKVETAVSLDGGVDYWFSGGVVTATVFSRHVHDQIDFVSPDPQHCRTDQIFGCYSNIDRTRASGLELGLKQNLGIGLYLKANYSFLATRNQSSGFVGNRLPRTPDQMGSADLTWNASDRLTLGVGVRHVGHAFDDVYNSRPLDAYTLVDLRADFAITDRINLYGRIENAGDTRYETAADYGQTGRRLWLGVRARLF